MAIEHIDVDFEIKQIFEDDDQLFRFEGLASTFGNIDLVDDIVARGAFEESIKQRMPKILWQHSSREPIGMPEIATETEEGLFIRAKLPKEDTFVSGRVIPQIKIGSINAMSIGFIDQDSETNGQGIRTLKKIDLKEVSLVSFPANELALISGFKNESKTVTPFENLALADRSRPWDASEAAGRIRTATGSTDSPSASYRKNFLWFDSSEPENFGSYKLPFVDIVDGKRMAIPRALNNAKARLDQTDIPASDKERVLSNINRYQDKLENSQPKSFYQIEDLKDLTARELEKCLRDSGIFSRKAAAYMANLPQGELVANNNDALTELLTNADKYLKAQEINKIMKKVSSYAT
jgi:HK97 family phage prohead protease